MTLKKIALALAAAFLISGTANGQAAQGLNSAAKRLDKPYSYSYFPTTEPITASSVTATALATPGSITVTPVLSKVGSITTVAGASLVDGDSFVIKYAPGLTVPIEFDLSPGDGTSGGAVPYIFTALDTADQIRDGLITLLNSAAGTALTASSGGAATVSLVLDTPGAVGDTNTEAVANVGFAVTGFVNPTAATTVTVRLVACYADNTCTEAGAASSTAASTATLSASNFLRYSWSAVPRAAKYKVYRTVAPTSPATTGVIYTGTALTVDDVALAGGGETAPTVDGTGRLTSDALTAGRVPIVGTGGRVEDDAGLTYDAATDTLTSGRVNVSLGRVMSGALIGGGTSDHGLMSVLWYSTDVRLAAGMPIVWTNNTNDVSATVTTGVSRSADGEVAAGTGANQDYSGSYLSDRTELRSANAASALRGQISELVTLSTAGPTTDTTMLVPANARVSAITYRITTAITTAVSYTIAPVGGTAYVNPGTATSSQTGVGATSTGVLVPATFDTQTNATAVAIRVTCNTTPGAGVARLTLFYEQFAAPGS